MTERPAEIDEAITEVIAPRIEAAGTYLPRQVLDFPAGYANLLYVFDEHHRQYLDFAAEMAPLGHRDPKTHAAIAEHLLHYVRPGPADEYVMRFPVEYAQALSESLTPQEWSGNPYQVLYCASELEALRAARIMAEETTGLGGHVLRPVNYDGRVEPLSQLVENFDTARALGKTVVFDECQAGYGRTASLWSHQQVPIRPDIIVLGGSGGGGFPFGAVVAGPRFFQKAPVKLGSQAGNPVICAAGLATLSQITPEVLAHVEDAGMALDAALEELVEQFRDTLVGTQGVGLLRTLDFHTRADAERFYTAVRAHGLLVARPVSSTIVLTPPLIISENEVRRGVDMMASTLLEWTDKGII